MHKACLLEIVWPILVLLFYFFRSASGAFVLSFFPDMKQANLILLQLHFFDFSFLRFLA